MANLQRRASALAGPRVWPLVSPRPRRDDRFEAVLGALRIEANGYEVTTTLQSARRSSAATAPRAQDEPADAPGRRPPRGGARATPERHRKKRELLCEMKKLLLQKKKPLCQKKKTHRESPDALG
jgi:hypothetical protein